MEERHPSSFFSVLGCPRSGREQNAAHIQTNYKPKPIFDHAIEKNEQQNAIPGSRAGLPGGHGAGAPPLRLEKWLCSFK